MGGYLPNLPVSGTDGTRTSASTNLVESPSPGPEAEARSQGMASCCRGRCREWRGMDAVKQIYLGHKRMEMRQIAIGFALGCLFLVLPQLMLLL